jgi:hypothetical protein
MLRTLPVLIAVPLVIAAGYVHGRWTNRWSPNRAVEAAVARLSRVPAEIGGWRGRDLELDRKTMAVAEIDGYVMRRYEDPRTGAAVSALLVCGRPGPIAAHTPEVCYGGAGYEPAGEPATQAIPFEGAAAPAEFFTAVFARPKAADAAALRLLWSWNGAGSWETSDNPRLTFARNQALYKLYIVREMASPAERSGDEPAVAFAKLLLPELQKALF